MSLKKTLNRNTIKTRKSIAPRIENVEIYINYDGSVDFADLPVELEPVRQSLNPAAIVKNRGIKPLIALITDFGLKDHFAGVMKGVIYSIFEDAKIIDISHGIDFGNIKQAAFMLMVSYKYFPDNTIFVGVVDPGVGSNRKAILIKTQKHFFIGPDNGIFSYVMKHESIEKIIELNNPEFFLHPVSNTFHGRDIFSPVSAYVAKGIDIDSLGQPLNKYTKIPFPVPVIKKDKIIGHIITTDCFGNLITDITPEILKKFFRKKNDKKILIHINDFIITKISSSYTGKTRKNLIAIWGSSGFLEISMNCNNAESFLKVQNITYKRD